MFTRPKEKGGERAPAPLKGLLYRPPLAMHCQSATTQTGWCWGSAFWLDTLKKDIRADPQILMKKPLQLDLLNKTPSCEIPQAWT